MLAIKNHNIYKKKPIGFCSCFKQGCFLCFIDPFIDLCLFYCNKQEHATFCIAICYVFLLQYTRKCKKKKKNCKMQEYAKFLLQYVRICITFYCYVQECAIFFYCNMQEYAIFLLQYAKNMQYFYCNWLLILYCNMQCFYMQEYAIRFIAISKYMHNFLLQNARICKVFIAICKNMQHFYCNMQENAQECATFLLPYARTCKVFYWSIQIYVKFLCDMQERSSLSSYAFL